MKAILQKVISFCAFTFFVAVACTNSLETSVDPQQPSNPNNPISKPTETNSGSEEWDKILRFGITGATTKPIRNDPDILGWLPEAQAVSLNPLKNPGRSGSFRLIAIGGSFAAGVRDGGVYQESQLTAFPNLVAHQMNVSFRQPLFDAFEGNGSGYKVVKNDGGPVLHFDEVTNQVGFERESPGKPFKKITGEWDNLAFPSLALHLDRQVSNPISYLAKSQSLLDDQNFVRFFQRVLPEDALNNPALSYLNWIESRLDCDFAIVDVGMQSYLMGAMTGGSINDIPTPNGADAGRPEIRLMKKLAEKGIKGVVLTIPKVLDFPYFKYYSWGKLKKITASANVFEAVTVTERGGRSRAAIEQDILLPSAGVASLFEKSTAAGVLTAKEVIARDGKNSEDEGYSFTAVNNWFNSDLHLKKYAKDYNLAVLDLYELYQQINTGQYVTHDGIKVTPDYPSGNFYSSDGIHPSAFGQAIIANECIKAINAKYGTSIAYLPTQGFLIK